MPSSASKSSLLNYGPTINVDISIDVYIDIDVDIDIEIRADRFEPQQIGSNRKKRFTSPKHVGSNRKVGSRFEFESGSL